MTQQIYDLAIIGSGPAGYAAAMTAVELNKHICIIENQSLGGAGIINGALTSKTLWQISENFVSASRKDLGYWATEVNVDFSQIIKKVREAAKEKIFQLRSQIETFVPNKFPNKSIRLIHGSAKFLDPYTLEICKANGCEIVKAKNFLIAAGSRPRNLNGIEIDHKLIINSNDILKLDKLPEKMIIIGSGIIGTEYATIFSNFGKTQVHLLDRQQRVIPFEDNDVSDFISNNLKNNGVIIHHNCQLRSLTKTSDDTIEVVLDYNDGRSEVFEVDLALIAIGRQPNTDWLSLDKLGFYLDDNNFLKTNDNLVVLNNNGYNHIFAAGDITSKTQLYSVAEAQGIAAVKNIFNIEAKKINYYNMPTLMFFKPEVAAVGLNEKMLQAQKIPYKAVFYSNKLINRAISMLDTNGFIKILISDDGQNRILGMRAAGPQASAMIVAIAHLLNEVNGVDKVLETVYPHPSIPEGIQDCLRILTGKPINKPFVFPHLINIKHWKPD